MNSKSFNISRFQTLIKKNLLDIILFFVIFQIVFYFSRLNIDVYHTGIIFSKSMQLANGETLYNGHFYYGPFTPFLNSIGLIIFGEKIYTIQLIASAFYGFISVTLYWILQRFLNNAISFFLVLFSFSLAPFYYQEFHPWPSVYALYFLLAACYYLILFVESRDVKKIIIVGILCSLCFWARPRVGVPLFFMLLALIPIINHQMSTAYKNIYLVKKFIYVFAWLFLLVILTLTIFDSVKSVPNFIYPYLGVSSTLAQHGPGLFEYIFSGATFTNRLAGIWSSLSLYLFAFQAYLLVILFLGRMKNNKYYLILLIYTAFCSVSFLQTFPVTEERHLFWSDLPFVALPFLILNELLKNIIKTKTIWLKIILVLPMILVGYHIANAYYFEIKHRFFVDDGNIMTSLPSKRVQTYKYDFKKPYILKGIKGTEEQVKILNKLGDDIDSIVSDTPGINLRCDAGWDRICNFFIQRNNGLTSSPDLTPGRLPIILSEGPLENRQPEWGKDVLLDYNFIGKYDFDMPFAYSAPKPAIYHLYAPKKYNSINLSASHQISKIKREVFDSFSNIPKNLESMTEISILVNGINFNKLNSIKLSVANRGHLQWATKPSHFPSLVILDKKTNLPLKYERKDNLNLTASSIITLLAPNIQGNICDYDLLLSFYFDNVNYRVKSECVKY